MIGKKLRNWSVSVDRGPAFSGVDSIEVAGGRAKVGIEVRK